MQIYSIFDTRAEEYAPIFEAKNDAVAVRYFLTALQSADAAFVNEYELHALGSVENGVLNPSEITVVHTPKILCEDE